MEGAVLSAGAVELIWEGLGDVGLALRRLREGRSGRIDRGACGDSMLWRDAGGERD